MTVGFLWGIGYEVCGIAAKDHSKINEGEAKGHQLVLLM